MKRASTITTLALAALLLAAPAVPAGAPTEQLRQYTDAVIKVLEDPALRGDGKQSERRAAVRKLAQEVFDVNETARRALGPHWRERTPAERQEFVQLFADLLEQTYISKIDLFGGERLRYTDEKVDGDHAIVRAKVVTKSNTEVPVEARMLNKDGRWLMYDVAIENVSLVSNYRSQFDRIIRTASYDELVKRLRSRDQMLQQQPPQGAHRTSQ